MDLFNNLPKRRKKIVLSSVADPDPDSPDPHVFGPPSSRSGSISQGYDPDPSIIKQRE
jgi:hypothetical protein